MKRKTMLEAMKKSALNEASKKPLSVLMANVVQSQNKETGESVSSIRFDVEVQKGCGDYSRCRFSVKVPGDKAPIPEEEFEKADFLVAFKNLEITYIDSQGNVYFKADAFSIKKEG